MNSIEKGYQAYANRRVETNALPEEEKLAINHLEEASDALWSNRKEVDYEYEKIKEFLPIKKTKAGKEVPLAVDDIKILMENGEIETALDFSIREKLKKNFSGNDLEEESVILKDEVSDRINKWLLMYEEMQKKDNFEERIRQYSQSNDENEKQQIWDQMPLEMKLLNRYRHFRLKELVIGKKALRDAESKIDLQKSLVERATKRNPESVRLQLDKLHKVIEKHDEILYSSPEIYYWKQLSQLDEWKDVLDSNGGIVKTPYVKEQIAKIASIVDGGRPAFVHGEMGGGKTELAMLMCREKYAKKHLERWEKGHPKPDSSEEVNDWEMHRKREIDPIMISGHKNMDTSVIFGGRGMEATVAPAPEEQARIIEVAVKKLEEDQKEAGKECTEEMKTELRKAYRDQFKNFVEVKEVLGMFYEAMKQGRPIIIDEMNAIPHSLLIALNEYLKAKPGNTIYPMIPGAESFPVQEGFVVIATGNWKPEDGKAYVGRQQLDAAFLSRFGIMHYDYLPQRRKGETQETTDENKRKEKAESELFILMATHILDKHTLGAKVPKGTFEKLRGLAQAARHIQDVFAETTKDSFTDPETQENYNSAKEILGENALSIRHLIPIVERWKQEGFKNDLDAYVFEDFVNRSKGARPKEMKYLYTTIQAVSGKYIFNTTKDKWPDAFSIEGIKKINDIGKDVNLAKFSVKSKFNLQSGTYDLENNFVKKSELRFYNPQEVVTEIFGPAPKRKFVDSQLFISDDKSEQSPVTTEEQMEQERTLTKLKEEIVELVNTATNSFEATENEKKIFKSF
jgi:MoxR-like ATPase